MTNNFGLSGIAQAVLGAKRSNGDSLFQSVWAILRVIVGVVMVHNGFDKLADIQGFADAYVAAIGLPFPVFFAYCAALTETLCAPLLAFGLLSRPAALALMSTMLVAIYHHVSVAGFNLPYLERSLLYSACFAFFAVCGGGEYSFDGMISDWLQGNSDRTVSKQN
ncbi:MAG: DoxX family protein [Cyanobacteria bacterium P01_D01_bin.123]